MAQHSGTAICHVRRFRAGECFESSMVQGSRESEGGAKLRAFQRGTKLEFSLIGSAYASPHTWHGWAKLGASMRESAPGCSLRLASSTSPPTGGTCCECAGATRPRQQCSERASRRRGHRWVGDGKSNRRHTLPRSRTKSRTESSPQQFPRRPLTLACAAFAQEEAQFTALLCFGDCSAGRGRMAIAQPADSSSQSIPHTAAPSLVATRTPPRCSVAPATVRLKACSAQQQPEQQQQRSPRIIAGRARGKAEKLQRWRCRPGRSRPMSGGATVLD